MPKARELTDVEKFYIENNLEKTDEQLASQMSGIGSKTVAKYRGSATKEDKRGHITETQSERTDRLGKGPKAGEFISKRDGASIMTEQASEVSDARKTVKGNHKMSDSEYEETNRDKIHKPQS